jgi:hypothetical protein
VSDLVDHSCDHCKGRSLNRLVYLVDEGRTGFWLSQNAEIPVLLPDFVPPQHNRIVSPKLEFETLNARTTVSTKSDFLKMQNARENTGKFGSMDWRLWSPLSST